jgi:hypothetical protein
MVIDLYELTTEQSGRLRAVEYTQAEVKIFDDACFSYWWMLQTSKDPQNPDEQKPNLRFIEGIELEHRGSRVPVFRINDLHNSSRFKNGAPRTRVNAALDVLRDLGVIGDEKITVKHRGKPPFMVCPLTAQDYMFGKSSQELQQIWVEKWVAQKLPAAPQIPDESRPVIAVRILADFDLGVGGMMTRFTKGSTIKDPILVPLLIKANMPTIEKLYEEQQEELGADEAILVEQDTQWKTLDGMPFNFAAGDIIEDPTMARSLLINRRHAVRKIKPSDYTRCGNCRHTFDRNETNGTGYCPRCKRLS